MAIGSTIQSGTTVYVYDERGSTLALIPVSPDPGDGLKGYTSKTVTVQQGKSLYTYDERGNPLAITNVG